MESHIIHGDAFDLIRSVSDTSIALVITSPPYFQQRSYTEDDREIGKEKDVKLYVEKLIVLFRECLRVTAPTGSLVWNLGDKYINSSLQLVPYRFAIEASKHAQLVNSVMWQKLNATPRQFRRRLVSSHEPFFHFVKSDDYYYHLPDEKPVLSPRKVSSKYFALIEESTLSSAQKANAVTELRRVLGEVERGELHSFRMKIKGVHAMPFGGQEGGRKDQILNNGFTIIRIHGRKMQKDVFESAVDSVKWKKHPAVYPLAIVERFLSMLTREGDVVLDTFMGSGTTAVACKKMNRHYIGFELCEEFVTESLRRIDEMA